MNRTTVPYQWYIQNAPPLTPPLIWYGTVVRFIGTVSGYGWYGSSVPTNGTNRTNRTNQPYQPYQPTIPTVRTRENTFPNRTVPYILEISLSPLAPILDLANVSYYAQAGWSHGRVSIFHGH